MYLAGHEVGIDKPLFLIAGPCVIEGREVVMETAEELRQIADEHGMLVIFKASFDKANRTSLDSFRGLGMEAGLRMLEEVRSQFGLPVLTDVHTSEQIDEVASVVDVLQTPAFLCRQTDFIKDVASTGKPVNIKKGQFLSAEDMGQVVNKAQTMGNRNIMICERGTTFGYNDLVVDMRGLEAMRKTGCPVVFDATHSVQQPGGRGNRSGGERKYVPVLARAAVAAGVSGIFIETHPRPYEALSDGPNSVYLSDMRRLIDELLDIDDVVKGYGL